MTAPTRAAVDQDLARLRDNIAAVRSELDLLVAAYTAPADAPADFFQPHHAYTLHHAAFRCEHLTVTPDTGELLAGGWYTHNDQRPLWAWRHMRAVDYQRWNAMGATDCPPATLTPEGPR